jgi:threonine-phosphate decarboxylase
LVVVDFPKRVIHGGTGKRQQEKTRKTVLDFSASVNPFPPQVEWQCDPHTLEYYPDDTYSELKEQIGRAFGRDPGEICVGNGSIELIRVFASVVLGNSTKQRHYYLEQPTFGESELSARLAGAEMAAAPDSADVWFVCNPNNPTGSLLPRSEILTRADCIRPQNGILFCDEAFITLSDPAQSVAGTRDPCLFVLHSLTKSFSVPGLRIGFGFGDPALIERIETARSPWCVNAFAEAFARQALLHLDDLAASRAAIAREREQLAGGMHNLGFTSRPSAANYLLVDCGRNVTSLCTSLSLNGILVRDCASFGLPTCIRVAVRTRDENRQLLEALAACVS